MRLRVAAAGRLHPVLVFALLKGAVIFQKIRDTGRPK